MKKTINIAVLEMGVLPDALAHRHGNFFQLVEQWLGRDAADNVCFSQLTVCEGAVLPQPQAFDAYVVSGSKHSVYEDLPWIQESKAFLLRLKQLGIPMFGICFGHQLMAEAFGGTVEKSPKGWGAGIDRYQMGEQQHDVLVVHQDQVVVLPEEAKVIGQSAHCEYGVLEYGFAAQSTQFHPEFTPELVADLLQQYRPQFGDDFTNRALLDLEQADLCNQVFAKRVMDFFVEHTATANAVL